MKEYYDEYQFNGSTYFETSKYEDMKKFVYVKKDNQVEWLSFFIYVIILLVIPMNEYIENMISFVESSKRGVVLRSHVAGNVSMDD